MDKISPKAAGIDTSTYYFNENLDAILSWNWIKKISPKAVGIDTSTYYFNENLDAILSSWNWIKKISPKAVGIDTSTHYLKEIPGCHSLFLDFLRTPTVIVTTRIIICLLILYTVKPPIREHFGDC